MADAAPVLIVFTRVPRPGGVKSRLIPAVGADGAAAVHATLVARTLHAARGVAGVRRQLCLEGLAADGGAAHAGAPPAPGVARAWLDSAVRAGGIDDVLPQAGGDLGERMHRALADALGAGAAGAVLVGTDCPDLDAGYLDAALAALRGGAGLVLGPVEDGGYVLIGLARPCAALFDGMTWSTDAVATQTLARARAQGLGVEVLRTLWDVDRPEDLIRLARRGVSVPGFVEGRG